MHTNDPRRQTLRPRAHGVFTRMLWLATALVLPAAGYSAEALRIERPWIRAAPPGASMLAGYAVLYNDSAAEIRITGARSAAFADVSIHQSTLVNGVAGMHEVPGISIAPHSNAVLAPNGLHLMLMDATTAPAEGSAPRIEFTLADGSHADAAFVIQRDAPPP